MEKMDKRLELPGWSYNRFLRMVPDPEHVFMPVASSHQLRVVFRQKNSTNSLEKPSCFSD
jgi:hypothetical protein